MTSFWNKLDLTLGTYREYLRDRDQAPADGRVTAALWYTGDVAAIAPLGFEVVVDSPEEGRASGRVDLSTLEQLAAHPAVRAITIPPEHRPTLDASVKHIKVRDIPTVWQIAGAGFSGTTGKNIIIGIIDGGIDYTRPTFSRTGSTRETRILRI